MDITKSMSIYMLHSKEWYTLAIKTTGANDYQKAGHIEALSL